MPICAILEIRGFSCAPEEISRLLNVTPTESWRIGDLVSSTQITRKYSGWRLQSESTERMELEPHLVWLLDRLPKTLDLSSLTEQWETLVRFDVHIAVQTPAVYFSHATINRLAQIGSALDVDLYVHRSGVNEGD